MRSDTLSKFVILLLILLIIIFKLIFKDYETDNLGSSFPPFTPVKKEKKRKKEEKKKGKINLEKMIRFLFLAKPSIIYK